MDILARKMAMIEWLINLQDLGLLKQVESLSEQDRFNPDGLSADQKAGLDHALAQIEKGEVLSGEEVRDRIKEKFKI